MSHFHSHISSLSRINIKNFHRVFQADLKKAETLAKQKARFIIFYIEEDLQEVLPTIETFQFRRALSDTELGDFINDQVLSSQCSNRNHTCDVIIVVQHTSLSS